LSRIPPIKPGISPATAPVEQRLMAARGEVSHLYRVLLNSPAAADGWEHFLTIVRQRLSLSPRLRELIILRIAVLNKAPYEFESHVPHALNAGLGEAQIAALRNCRTDGLDDTDCLVLELTDAMTRDVRVDDALFARVAANFDKAGLVDLIVTIAAYNMVSRFLGAAGIE